MPRSSASWFEVLFHFLMDIPLSHLAAGDQLSWGVDATAVHLSLVIQEVTVEPLHIATHRLCYLPVSACLFLQLRTMCQFGNQVSVEVLPPYIPSKQEKDDPVLYAANIRKLIVSPKQGC